MFIFFMDTANVGKKFNRQILSRETTGWTQSHLGVQLLTKYLVPTTFY